MSYFQTATIEPTEMTVLLGNLKVLSNGPLVMGSDITLNGKPLAVKSIRIEGDVKGAWLVTLEYYPGIDA